MEYDPDFALQQELERLAGNAFNPSSPSAETLSTTVSRWQSLFNLSPSDAAERIIEHRNNLTRTRISDEHWDELCAEKEGQGYDREAYEYSLEMQKKAAMLPSLVPVENDRDEKISFLIELTGPLDKIAKVREVSGLDEDPEVVKGRSWEDAREVMLCCIGATAKEKILRWASKEGGGFEPTILVDPRSMK